MSDTDNEDRKDHRDRRKRKESSRKGSSKKKDRKRRPKKELARMTAAGPAPRRQKPKDEWQHPLECLEANSSPSSDLRVDIQGVPFDNDEDSSPGSQGALGKATHTTSCKPSKGPGKTKDDRDPSPPPGDRTVSRPSTTALLSGGTGAPAASSKSSNGKESSKRGNQVSRRNMRWHTSDCVPNPPPTRRPRRAKRKRRSGDGSSWKGIKGHTHHETPPRRLSRNARRSME